MPNKITHTQIYVLDQDEALDFYVGKLGFCLLYTSPSPRDS